MTYVIGNTVGVDTNIDVWFLPDSIKNLDYSGTKIVFDYDKNRSDIEILEEDNNLKISFGEKNLKQDDVMTLLMNCIQMKLLESDKMLLHASAASTTDGALVFIGKSGMGKTPVLVNMLERGMGYMSDEVTVIDDRSMVFPLTRKFREELGKKYLLPKRFVKNIAKIPGVVKLRHIIGGNYKPDKVESEPKMVKYCFLLNEVDQEYVSELPVGKSFDLVLDSLDKGMITDYHPAIRKYILSKGNGNDLRNKQNMILKKFLNGTKVFSVSGKNSIIQSKLIMKVVGS